MNENIGYCPVCRTNRHSLPGPAEGNCSHCFNHLLVAKPGRPAYVDKLIDGMIPPHTNCPWKDQCSMGKDGGCGHQGTNHTVPFSCGAARGFEICRTPSDNELEVI